VPRSHVRSCQSWPPDTIVRDLPGGAQEITFPRSAPPSVASSAGCPGRARRSHRRRPGLRSRPRRPRAWRPRTDGPSAACCASGPARGSSTSEANPSCGAGLSRTCCARGYGRLRARTSSSTFERRAISRAACRASACVSWLERARGCLRLRRATFVSWDYVDVALRHAATFPKDEPWNARPSPVSPWGSGPTPVSPRIRASSMGRTWWCPMAGRTPHTTVLYSLTCRPGEARQTRWSRQRVRWRLAVVEPRGSGRRRRVRQQRPATRRHARVRPQTPSIPSPRRAVESSPIRGGFGSTGGQSIPLHREARRRGSVSWKRIRCGSGGRQTEASSERQAFLQPDRRRCSGHGSDSEGAPHEPPFPQHD